MEFKEGFHIHFFSIGKEWKCVIQNWNLSPKGCYKDWHGFGLSPAEAYKQAIQKMEEYLNKKTEVKKHESTIVKKTNFSSLFGD